MRDIDFIQQFCKKDIISSYMYEKAHNTAFSPHLSHTLVWSARVTDTQSDSNSEKSKCCFTLGSLLGQSNSWTGTNCCIM